MKTFNELDLIKPLQETLANENYTTPTPIQIQTIPSALLGRDVLGCAQTGTGKTAAFALPILNRLGKQNRRATPHRPFALVLAPTRELAIQIKDSFAKYGKQLHLRQGLVYGGVSQMQQVRAMKRGVHILVATPGRLLDLMNQGHIKLDQLSVFVLDEADRMLDMGFLPDLKRIISCLPDQRQSLFFSATLGPKIDSLAQQLLRNPVNVNVTPKTKSVKLIDQRVLFVESKGKLELLKRVLGGSDVDRALVFTRTKRMANLVADKLERSGAKATAIHGNKSQNARERALTAFRNNHVRVLVATDVASRGIDIDGITHVVNYDIPDEPESYLHRIGRTGRAGAAGIAYSFCSHGERGDLRAIEKLIGQRVPAGELHPSLENSRAESAEEPGSKKSVGSAGARSTRKSSGFRRGGQPDLGTAVGEGDKSSRRRRPRRKTRRPVKQMT